MFRVKAQGVEQVIRDYKKYDEETQLKVRKATRRNLNRVRRFARKHIHSVTGTLSRRIKVVFDDRVMSGVTNFYAPHAHLVEFGTKGKGTVKPRNAKVFRLPNGHIAKSFTHKGMKARPFIRPAFNEVEPMYIKDVKKAVKNAKNTI